MLIEMGKRARQAARILGRAETELKNALLTALAEELLKQIKPILTANAQDIADGKKQG